MTSGGEGCFAVLHYPIPYISDILAKLKDAKFVTSLDLTSGFHQIELEPGSKQHTAFTVPEKGLF